MLLICYLNTMDHCCFYCAKPCQEICNDCQIYAFCSPEHKEYHQVNNTCLPFKVLHYIHNKCLNCLLHFFSKYLSSCFCFSNSSQKMLGSIYLLFENWLLNFTEQLSQNLTGHFQNRGWFNWLWKLQGQFERFNFL